ncbi:hypothetical protein FDN13_13015 [Caloramator sp. E03]|uniref:hypothetical protein n=1 Tax=Caloramator sp. E03 TaxID=2576307 RepID=UPI0011104DE8|nr:hypothetical protein [Caloramator sp. E03]QCX34546.1 hypothetical protein FDN13_13015 [Caloramator sp. E03]
MVNKEQLMAVAASCSSYSPKATNSSYLNYGGATCELCAHWDGERCMINVYDKVLNGLDQT